MEMNRTTFVIASVGLSTLVVGCGGMPQARLDIRAVNQGVEANGTSQEQLARAKDLLKSGQTAFAVTAFRTVLRTNPHNAQANNGLAIAYDRIGKKELAQRYFELAVASDPLDQRFRGNLAKLLVRDGKPEKARDLLAQPSPVMQAKAPAEVETIKFVANEEAATDPGMIVAKAVESVLVPEAAVADAGQSEGDISAIIADLNARIATRSKVEEAGTAVKHVRLASRPATEQSARITVVARSIEPEVFHTGLFPGSPGDGPGETYKVIAALPRSGRRGTSPAHVNYLERTSLTEVRLVTRPLEQPNVKSTAHANLHQWLETWLPTAIARENSSAPLPNRSSNSMLTAVTRAAIEEAVAALKPKPAGTETPQFAYIFFPEDTPEAGLSHT
jgi:Tetratricopeptide repeat